MVKHTIGLGALTAAALVIAGLSASVALAAGPNLYIKGALQTNGASHEVETKIKSATFKLEVSIGTEPVTLEATGVKSTKAFVKGTEPASDRSEVIEFIGVKVTSPSTCTGDTVTSRKEPGATKTANGVVATKEVSTEFLEGGLSDVLDRFSPTSGTVFVEIELAKAGSCPLATTYYVVKGSENGKELEPGEEAEWKTLKFPAEGSKLEFDGKEASLTGEAEERLTSLEGWTVQGGVNISATHLGPGAGGKPGKCTFAIKFEKCEIEVKNLGFFRVRIIGAEITGIESEARYKLTPETCTMGTVLESEPPKGGTCRLTVQPIAEPAVPGEWKNNALAIEVKQCAGVRCEEEGKQLRRR